jgi:hypothetical protein
MSELYPVLGKTDPNAVNDPAPKPVADPTPNPGGPPPVNDPVTTASPVVNNFYSTARQPDYSSYDFLPATSATQPSEKTEKPSGNGPKGLWGMDLGTTIMAGIAVAGLLFAIISTSMNKRKYVTSARSKK